MVNYNDHVGNHVSNCRVLTWISWVIFLVFLLINQPSDLSDLPVERKMKLEQPYQYGLSRKDLCRLWRIPYIKPSYESRYEKKYSFAFFHSLSSLFKILEGVKSSNNENIHTQNNLQLSYIFLFVNFWENLLIYDIYRWLSASLCNPSVSIYFVYFFYWAWGFLLAFLQILLTWQSKCKFWSI